MFRCQLCAGFRECIHHRMITCSLNQPNPLPLRTESSSHNLDSSLIAMQRIVAAARSSSTHMCICAAPRNIARTGNPACADNPAAARREERTRAAPVRHGRCRVGTLQPPLRARWGASDSRGAGCSMEHDVRDAAEATHEESKRRRRIARSVSTQSSLQSRRATANAQHIHTHTHSPQRHREERPA